MGIKDEYQFDYLDDNQRFADQVKEDGEERYDMCKAFEDMKLEGIEIGLAEGMEKGIEKGIRALIETCMNIKVCQGKESAYNTPYADSRS